MSNLYNKIYEAIDNGIQKALVITDNQSNDISVYFHHKQISNDSDNMEYYVNEFINGDIDDAYDYLITYHIKTGKKYKAKNLSQFIKMLKMFFDTNNKKGVQSHWLDTYGIVTYIFDDGSELDFADTIYLHDKKPVFLKIKSEKCDHPIILQMGLADISMQQWQKYESFKDNYTDSIGYLTENEAYNDMNGWKNTYNNRNIIKEGRKHLFTDYPALKYISKLNVMNGYKAYIPAVGEMKIITDIRDSIATLISLASATNTRAYSEFIYFEQRKWLTSSIHQNPKKVYIMKGSMFSTVKNNNVPVIDGIQVDLNTESIFEKCRIIPFFKKI